MHDAARISSSDLLLDRMYRLHERLGRGGMGSVYRATCLMDGAAVAVKLVSAPDSQNLHSPTPAPALAPTTDERLLRLALAREFQALASLHHPNIVQVYSYGFDAARGPYVAMELLKDSRHILSAAALLETPEKVLLFSQLLRALSYIHQRGVIHRDIKPTAGAGRSYRWKIGF